MLSSYFVFEIGADYFVQKKTCFVIINKKRAKRLCKTASANLLFFIYLLLLLCYNIFNWNSMCSISTYFLKERIT